MTFNVIGNIKISSLKCKELIFEKNKINKYKSKFSFDLEFIIR